MSFIKQMMSHIVYNNVNEQTVTVKRTKNRAIAKHSPPSHS